MSKVGLYEAIKADLETITGVNTVALWRNQLERENKENPFLYPAIFVEFMQASFMESSSKAYQSVDMTVRLHICFEGYETEDLSILELVDATYAKMQMKCYGTWGAMKRRNEEQNFDHDNVQDYIQDYLIAAGHDYVADQRPSVETTITTLDVNTTYGT